MTFFKRPSAVDVIKTFEAQFQRKIEMPKDLENIAKMLHLKIIPWSTVCEPSPNIYGILLYKNSQHFIGVNDLPEVTQVWHNFVIAKAIGDHVVNLSMIHIYISEDLKSPTYFDLVEKPKRHEQKLHQASLRFALELLMPAEKFNLDWSIHLANPDVYSLDDVTRQYQTLPQAVTARAQFKLPS